MSFCEKIRKKIFCSYDESRKLVAIETNKHNQLSHHPELGVSLSREGQYCGDAALL
jgi:hypothetical protein